MAVETAEQCSENKTGPTKQVRQAAIEGRMSIRHLNAKF